MAFKTVKVMKVMKAKGVISAKTERSSQLERSLKREVSAKGDKRGMGRPRKVQMVAKPEVVVKRGRGRPRKVQIVVKREVSAEGDKMMKMEGMDVVKRGRGRPRKLQIVAKRDVGVKIKVKAEVATKLEVGIKGVKRKGKVPIVAKGRLSRFMVFSGRRMRTVGGLRKENIGINKRGRYVSLKQSAHGSKIYNANIKGWNVAFRTARRQLKCKGFVAINGKSLMGPALYLRMKEVKEATRRWEQEVKEALAQNEEEEVKEEKVVTLVEVEPGEPAEATTATTFEAAVAIAE